MSLHIFTGKMPVKMKRLISLKEPHLANSLSVATQLLAQSDHRHIFNKLQELLSAPGCIWPFTLDRGEAKIGTRLIKIWKNYTFQNRVGPNY